MQRQQLAGHERNDSSRVMPGQKAGELVLACRNKGMGCGTLTMSTHGPHADFKAHCVCPCAETDRSTVRSTMAGRRNQEQGINQEPDCGDYRLCSTFLCCGCAWLVVSGNDRVCIALQVTTFSGSESSDTQL